jgi:hypothetical protein
MSNLITALGSNAAAYEELALKIVDLIDTTTVSLEISAIALKTAQLIIDTRERDAWDAVWTRMEQPTFLQDFAASQEMPHASQV